MVDDEKYDCWRPKKQTVVFFFYLFVKCCTKTQNQNCLWRRFTQTQNKSNFSNCRSGLGKDNRSIVRAVTWFKLEAQVKNNNSKLL